MKNKTLLIYNPHAGTKRRLLPNQAISLEEIKQLLIQYQIPVDFHPTKYPKHATDLAKQAAKDGYKMVIAAGGDGTVGEVANGLVDSDVILGIIPLGSVMNVARMLSIPTEVEKAVEIIKIGQTRKIDVGKINFYNNDQEAGYFLESAGLGLEAQLQENFQDLDHGDWGALLRIFKTLFEYYTHKVTITLDNQTVITRAILIIISNGPYTGASFEVAPKAKLNDHLLTVTLFKMSRLELLNYFLRVIHSKKRYSPKIVIFQTKKAKIETKVARVVHADARIFGSTPVEFSIIPNALNVITGFPKKGETALLKKETSPQKKTYLN